MRGPKKELICKRCGHRIGTITPKLRFHIKLIAVGFLIALMLNTISEFIVQKAFGY